MDFKKIQKFIDDTGYWDARVEAVECKYFSDEVTVSFKDNSCLVNFIFKECYKTLFDHVKSYEKNMPVKEMTYSQIPYFLTDVNVVEVREDNNVFLKCQLTMFPLSIEILCKDIVVQKTT